MNYIAHLNYLKGCGIIPNFSELSRVYHIDRRTLKKYYTNGGKNTRKKRKYHSEFDDYEEIINRKFNEPGNTLKGIFEFLVNMYSIKTTYNNFKAYCLRRKKVLKKTSIMPHVRFETDMGEQLQVDWKEDLSMTNRNGEVFTFNIYSATLGYSRKHLFIYTKTKTEIDFIRCTIEAFKTLGGTPKHILTDNMSAIVSAKGNKRIKHPKIIAFEMDSGVKIKLCKVRSPQTKGKDESANRFVNRLTAYNNDFDTLDDLLKIIENLNLRVNEEINQTTKIPPNVLFQKEKEHLLPMPNKIMLETYLDGFTRKVPETLLVDYNGNSYSVPKDYIGKTVKCIPSEDNLYIYCNTKLIRIHKISLQKINYNKSDYIEGLKATIKSDDFDYEKAAKQNLERFTKINNNGK